jgi:hypothetical protein
MKKHLLIVVVFLSFGSVLNNASAQANANVRQSTAIPRKPTAPNQTVVDLRPQCNAILNRKRDGKFLLYTDEEGRKVFFTVRGGKPGPIEVFGKGGTALPAVRKRGDGHGGGGCITCYAEYGTWHCYNSLCSFGPF